MGPVHAVLTLQHAMPHSASCQASHWSLIPSWLHVGPCNESRTSGLMSGQCLYSSTSWLTRSLVGHPCVMFWRCHFSRQDSLAKGQGCRENPMILPIQTRSYSGPKSYKERFCQPIETIQHHPPRSLLQHWKFMVIYVCCFHLC